MLKLRGNGAKIGCKSLQSSASVLGLAAGALSVSGMAYAANEETQIQTLFPADHYSLKDDGVVILKLENGEHFSLNHEQYLIL